MDVSIANVHLDLGAGRRGTDMGPSAIHVAGLVPALERLGHEIAAVHSLGMREAYEAMETGNPRVRYLKDIATLCRDLAGVVEGAVGQGHFPLVLGGDHSQAVGTISGLVRHYRRQGERVGVVWIDAHTDMNTPESSPSGNVHGMPLAALLGHGPPELVSLVGPDAALRPEDVVIIGVRDVDGTEVPLVRELGVRTYTMSELDSRGTAHCLREAIAIALDGTAGIHLSFDLDGVDPNEAPGVGTPVPGGLSLRESHLICELVHNTNRVLGMEVVELNPTLDIANKTARLAVWLIQSTLGKKILQSVT